MDSPTQNASTFEKTSSVKNIDGGLAVKHIRITQAGKLRGYVGNTLGFLQPDDLEETAQLTLQRSVVLHTLPAAPHLPPTAVERSTEVDPGASNSPASEPQSITQKSASVSTTTVPRLISVVQIIKREYMNLLDTRRSKRMDGLHQYNEVGILEDVGIVIRDQGTTESDGQASGYDQEAQRSMEILQAMSGRNHLRQKQTPFMRITLSTVERPDLVARGAWYQPPDTRKVSKKAKARAKKRAKKAQDKSEGGEIDIRTDDTGAYNASSF